MTNGIGSIFGKVSKIILGLACAFALTACGATSTGGGNNDGSGPTVPVALLVPAGSSDAQVRLIAQNLTNAARLAAADLNGVNIDLRIYDTAGSPGLAAQVATQAANEGAKVIVGPLYAQSANAAGLAVSGAGLNVLSFSNNPDIAGGNVFVLGNTFDNTARRLVDYSNSKGLNRYMVVNGQSTAEEVGRNAIVRAIGESGANLVASASFPLSQEGVTSAVPRIVSQAQSSGANVLFLTSGTEAALPFLAQMLPEAGLTAQAIQYAGLTRWDVPASAMTLPGVQGGWFAIPDPNATSGFNNRYAAAFGNAPHPIAGLAYDGVAAVGALAKSGGDLSRNALIQSKGYAGSNGVFRFLSNGSNQRALAIASVEGGALRIISSAPKRLGGFGF